MTLYKSHNLKTTSQFVTIDLINATTVVISKIQPYEIEIRDF